MKINVRVLSFCLAITALVGCSATPPVSITSAVQVVSAQATASGAPITLKAFSVGGVPGVAPEPVQWQQPTWNDPSDPHTGQSPGSIDASTGIFTPPTTPGNVKVVALVSKGGAGQRTEVNVQVLPGISLDVSGRGMLTGKTLTLTGSSVPAGYSTLNWELVGGPAGGASVNAATGVFSALAEGVYAVEAKLVTNPTVKQRLTVEVLKANEATMILAPANPSVLVGKQIQFVSSVAGVTWSATGGSIDANGLFTAPFPTSPSSITVTARKGVDSVSTTVLVNSLTVGVRFAATRNGAPVDPLAPIDVIVGQDSVRLTATPLFNGSATTVAASEIEWIISKDSTVVSRVRNDSDLAQPKLDLALVTPKVANSLGSFSVQYKYVPTNFISDPVVVNVLDNVGNTTVEVRSVKKGAK